MSSGKSKCPKCGTTILEFESICPICHINIRQENIVIDEPKEVEKEKSIDDTLKSLIHNEVGEKMIKNYAGNDDEEGYWERLAKALAVYYHENFSEKLEIVNSSIMWLFVGGVLVLLLGIIGFGGESSNPNPAPTSTQSPLDIFYKMWIFIPAFFIIVLVVIVISGLTKSTKNNNDDSKNIEEEFLRMCESLEVTKEMYSQLVLTYPDLKMIYQKANVIEDGE